MQKRFLGILLCFLMCSCGGEKKQKESRPLQRKITFHPVNKDNGLTVDTTGGNLNFILDTSKMRHIAHIKFYHGKRKLDKKDTVPRGALLSIRVDWDQDVLRKVTFDDTTYYQPSLEELKNGKYAFETRIEKTIKFEYTCFYSKKNKQVSYSYEIYVEN